MPVCVSADYSSLSVYMTRPTPASPYIGTSQPQHRILNADEIGIPDPATLGLSSWSLIDGETEARRMGNCGVH